MPPIMPRPLCLPVLSSALSLILFAGCIDATAQPLSGGARAAALGYATTALPGEHGGQANAAGALLQETVLSFFVREAFGLPELRYGTVQFVHAGRGGAVSLGVGTFGYDAFRMTHFEAGYVRALHFGTSRSFAAGLNVRYYTISADHYGTAGTWGVSGGWFFPLLPDLFVGFQATNAILPERTASEALPRSLAFGIGYRADDRLFVLAEVYKDVLFPASLRAGVELLPIPILALRTGLTTRPARYTGGVGLNAGPLVVDLAAEYHAVLGWSPAIALSLHR
jgi:hypothetical protein